VNLVERCAPWWLPTLGRFALVLGTLTSGTAIAQAPVASSNFIGFEDPLSEDGAWVARVQTSAPSTDSGYSWWGSLAGAADNFVYRIQTGSLRPRKP